MSDNIDVRAIRTALGWTQSKLAAALGVESTTVARWEQGHRSPRSQSILRTLAKLKKQATSATKI